MFFLVVGVVFLCWFFCIGWLGFEWVISCLKEKSWTKPEAKKHRNLVEDTQPWKDIAAELHRSEDTIRQKCRRLGLEVVGAKGYRTTTSLKLPKELPSVEESLKILAAALKSAAQSGLDNTNIQRLHVVDTLSRA